MTRRVGLGVAVGIRTSGLYSVNSPVSLTICALTVSGAACPNIRVTLATRPGRNRMPPSSESCGQPGRPKPTDRFGGTMTEAAATTVRLQASTPLVTAPVTRAGTPEARAPVTRSAAVPVFATAPITWA